MSGYFRSERKRIIEQKSLSAPLVSAVAHKVQRTKNAAADAFLGKHADPHSAITSLELMAISDSTMGPLQPGQPRLQRTTIKDRVFFGSVVTLPVVHVAKKGKGPVTHLLATDALGQVMTVHVYEGTKGASVAVCLSSAHDVGIVLYSRTVRARACVAHDS